MTRIGWTVPAGVFLASLAAAAGFAVVGGVRASEVEDVLLYSVVGTAASGLAAAVVLWVFRHRSMTMHAAVAALAPILAVAVAVGWAAWAMFLMAHDVLVLCETLVAAGTLGLVIALVLGRRVVQMSADIAGMARRLAEPNGAATPVGRPAGPGELAALGRELEATSARLREARALAEHAEQTRRELVAWVSHDLRTPLAGIRALAEALEDGVVDDPETVARYHSSIHLEAKRLTGMVNDLFELSRIQAGALGLEMEWVPLDELIADVIDASRAAAGHVDLVVCPTSGAPVVEMSAPEIVRVLRNLIDNAVRHTPEGGQVTVAAGAGAGDAWIAVSDSCGGIPAADLARVFEPGWRGDAARTPGDGRAGLGLAVAWGLVDAHGGGIDVCNTGPGCRFTIHLPLRQTDEGALSRPSSSCPPSSCPSSPAKGSAT